VEQKELRSQAHSLPRSFSEKKLMGSQERAKRATVAPFWLKPFMKKACENPSPSVLPYALQQQTIYFITRKLFYEIKE